MDQRSLPPLNLTRSKDSVRSNSNVFAGSTTPKSSYIISLPESPLSPRSPSPSGGRAGPGGTPRPSAQLRSRERDVRPQYLPFRRISLPSVPGYKRDSVASVLSVDSVQEREEQPQDALISTSLPTESSMPRLDDIDIPLALPPLLPVSSSSTNSSPSRRVAFLPPVTPTRVRPRPPTHKNNQGFSRPGVVGRHSRRTGSKTQAVTRNKEREEKKRKVLQELLDTEQTYVDGLDLVYNHFLDPLIKSLTTSHPLITPADLSVVFPGFIDILNFNRTFLADLRSIVVPEPQASELPIPSANHSSTSLAGPSSLNEATGSLLRPTAELSSSVSSTSHMPYNASNSHPPHPHPHALSAGRPDLSSTSYTSIYSNANLDLSSSALHEDADPGVPNIAPLLAQHVPYLKLYKPFVTAFSASMERLAKLSANDSFKIWLRDKERDPACGMLGLRSYLLSVVQRCPRYRLLINDLVKYTGEEEEGYSQLVEAATLLSEITGSLNTSLADHTAVLALLDLQRNTTNLPADFSFVAPGRSLVRRGRLRMSGQEVMREDVMRRGIGQQIRRVGISGWADDEEDGDREVLLFSDCVVWLEKGREWGLGSGVGAQIGMGLRPNAAVRHSVGMGRPNETPRRPVIGRMRSKSEAELPTLKSQNSGLAKSPDTPKVPSGSSSAFVKGSGARMDAEGKGLIGEGRSSGESSWAPPNRPSMPDHAPSNEDRWKFRGMASLMDVEVVISPRNAVQIDFLSPEGSFALYASTYDEREEWISAIRSTKATLLATFNVIHPDSTLTSSSSTTHIRRVLQALPYAPGEATIRAARTQSTIRKSILRKGRAAPVAEESEEQEPELPIKETKRSERRERVEHFVPAIWVPDKESTVCMRCQAAFGWRRRRHHCRLCGRVVCAGCSQKNFFVMDPTNASASKLHKPERACSLCYEAVFPVIHSSEESLHTGPDGGGTIMPTRHSPARPRILQQLIPARSATDRGRAATPPSPKMLTPSTTTTAGMGTSPSGNTIVSSASSYAGTRAQIVPSATDRTLTLIDSQRTVQAQISSELSSMTSSSQPSRPRSLDVGRRFAAASAFVQTAGVTARTKATGRGKNKRMSLVSGRQNSSTEIPRDGILVDDSTATLGRGAAAQQLSELLGRSPK